MGRIARGVQKKLTHVSRPSDVPTRYYKVHSCLNNIIKLQTQAKRQRITAFPCTIVALRQDFFVYDIILKFSLVFRVAR